ncbi:MAG: metallophosphoesterase [Turicibacter sp.]
MKVKRISIGSILVCLMLCFVYHQNKALSITQIPIESDDIPSAFDDYKIVHLSDLHHQTFGKNQEKLLQQIQKINPDIIFLTGDLIDSKRLGDEASLTLVKHLAANYPIYFVTGNHEAWSGQFTTLNKKLEKMSVNVLRNEAVVLEKGQDHIYLLGIDDPSFQASAHEESVTASNLSMTMADVPKDSYTILLAHRPEYLGVYAQQKINLVFSGHAHGGQFRLPFIGGLVAPNQGWFPAFTEGVYSKLSTNMVVSRGLGNSIIPIRLFNRPEIVVVTLRRTI